MQRPAHPPPLSRITRRQQAAQETRRRVVASARTLFHRRGFDQVTADEIAAAAGVAKGTLFLHAGSKERLLVLVYEAGLTDAVERALGRARAGGPIVAVLMSMFREFFRLYEANQDLSHRFIRELMTLPQPETEAMAASRHTIVDGLTDVIERRQVCGEVRADVDARLAATTSFALYFWVLLVWLSGMMPDARARDRALRDHLGLLWRGLHGGAPSRR